jgi:hypothetical protein
MADAPSLSVAIGVAIPAGGFGSRPWSLVLAALGFFYAAFVLFASASGSIVACCSPASR